MYLRTSNHYNLKLLDISKHNKEHVNVVTCVKFNMASNSQLLKMTVDLLGFPL